MLIWILSYPLNLSFNYCNIQGRLETLYLTRFKVLRFCLSKTFLIHNFLKNNSFNILSVFLIIGTR